MFAGISLASVLALLATRHWFFELFTHFRPYYLLFQALLVLVLIGWRKHTALALTVMLGLPNLWFVGPYIAPWLVQESAAVVSGDSLNVIVINLNYRNHEHATVLDYLHSRSPDVILLSELTPEWQAAIAELEADYPYHATSVSEGPYGMGLYSRVPVSDIEMTDLGAPGTVNFRAELEIAGRQLDIYGVHLMSPVNQHGAATRIEQFDVLKEYIAASRHAGHVTLVTGDFNSTPFSPYFVDLLEATGLEDAARRYGLRLTWPTYGFPLGIQIDHCLVAPGEAVARVDLGPDIGTDHLPLEIEVGPILATR